MIHLESDYSEIDRELDRILNFPNRRAKLLLDAVLEHAYRQSQAAVHVDTGSLKSSGKKSSKAVGTKWIGELQYGGVSAGPHNPVDYAIYEKARGNGHDFLENVHLLHSLWIEALLKGLSPK